MKEGAAGAPAVETGGQRAGRRLLPFLRRNVTPRLSAALALWRVEARLALPTSLFLVATMGRWNGALAMGGIMAVYAAVFLFLLEGERALEEIRLWLAKRRWARRYVLPLAEGQGRSGNVHRLLALPASVLLFGPFWRALTYHLMGMRRLPAYALSVGGSIPHSLLWTGVFVGGLWEAVLRPLLQRAGLW